MNTMTEAVDEVKARDQHQSWLMRHGQHWNDVRSQTFDACLEADHAQAIDLDPQARELAIFRTNAARHLSDGELVRAVDAYADDLRKRDRDAAEGRCEACGNAVMFNEPHGATCPLDEEALEEAAANVLALTSFDELVARGAELRCPGGPQAFPACGKPVELNGYCVDHDGCARCATTHPHAADRHNFGAGCVHAPSR